MRLKSKLTILGISVILTAFLIASYTRWPIETPLSQYISPRDDYYLQTEKLVYEVMDDLVNLRELNGSDDIKIQIITVDWAKEHWGRKTSNEEIEQLKIEEEIYEALFIVPEEFDLLAKKEQEAGSILAALAGDTLYFVSDYFDPYDEVNAKETIAHETAHLLQSINFEIPEYVDFDATLAQGALIEGEAEVTKAQYLERILKQSVDKAIFPIGNRTMSVDEFFWLKWVAPGIFGIEFVETLYKEGGWSMVNEAFIDMPMSMEQIMHPEKYSAEEGYLEFEVEAIEDWTLKRNDRLGELFITLFLSRHLPIDDARTAAEGWGGDRFAYFTRDADYLFKWQTSWDTLTDTNEFHSALERLLQSLEADEIMPQLWKIGEDYLRIDCRSLNVTITGASYYEAVERV